MTLLLLLPLPQTHPSDDLRTTCTDWFKCIVKAVCKFAEAADDPTKCTDEYKKMSDKVTSGCDSHTSCAVDNTNTYLWVGLCVIGLCFLYCLM